MKLKKLEVNDFGGINHNSPIVIDFNQSKFVLLEGDQELNKTTLCNSLLMATASIGAPSAKTNIDFINRQTGKIDINLSFVGNDRRNYDIRCTKSSFSLTCEGESVPEPITQMKKLLGIVAVSPMDIKFKKLEDIIKWLSSYANKNPEEFIAKMGKYKSGAKESALARAAANKSATALSEYLKNDDLYIKWEESEVKFAKDVDLKNISARLDAAGKVSNKYIQAETKLKQLKERQDSITIQIENLQNELEEINKSVKIGEKYVEENKSAKKEYDAIKKEYDNAANQSIQFNKWQEVKRKKTQLDEFEDISQKADAREKEFLQSLTKLQSEILPDIKGVELVTEDTHEDGVQKKEGLYWNGKNFAQLSESETWNLVMQIWRKYKVKVVVIDNYSSLGSKAEEMLLKLVKDGAHVLAAQMNREKKELEIIYE